MEINIFVQAQIDFGTGTPTNSSPNPNDIGLTWASYANNIIANGVNGQSISSIYFPNLEYPYSMRGSLYINKPFCLRGEAGTCLKFDNDTAISYLTTLGAISSDNTLPRVALFLDTSATGFRIEQLTLQSDLTGGASGTLLMNGIWAKAAFFAEKISIYTFSNTGIFTNIDNWQIAFSFISGCGQDGFLTSGSGGTALYLHTSYCGRKNENTPNPIYYGIKDISEKGNLFLGCHSATNSYTGSFLSENRSVWVACYTEDEDPKPVINNGSLWMNQERSVPTGNGTIWTGNNIWMNEGHEGVKFINNINPDEQVIFTAGGADPNTIFEFGAAKDVIESPFAPMLGDVNSEVEELQLLSPSVLQKIARQYPNFHAYLKLVQFQDALLLQQKNTNDPVAQQKIAIAINEISTQKKQIAQSSEFITEQDNIDKTKGLMMDLLANTANLISLREQNNNTTDPRLLADFAILIKQAEILVKDYHTQIQSIGIEPYEWAFLNMGVWKLRFDPNELANNTWFKLVYHNNALSHVAPAMLFSSGLTPVTEADSGSIAFPKGFYLGSNKIKITSSNQQPMGATRVGSVAFNNNPVLGDISGWIYVGETEGWVPFNLFE